MALAWNPSETTQVVATNRPSTLDIPDDDSSIFLSNETQTHTAVKLAVLRKLRGDRGGVVTYGIVQAPVPLQRRQVHESAADQENERLLKMSPGTRT